MRAEPSPVALTFDDGPDPVWTPQVLGALAEAGARATFFVVAGLACRYPALLSRIREAGHEVAFHCTEHVRHDALTPAHLEEDVTTGLSILERHGHPIRDWRTPWGVVTPATVEVARTRRLRLVGWTADTEDWRDGAPDEMLARVEPDLVRGAIVLLHDGVGPGAQRDGCAKTVGLVGPLVALARSRGLEAVPTGELRSPLPEGNPDPGGPASPTCERSPCTRRPLH